jgi:phospholipid/cholesterol/gamma-HCH transport system substrate-binding protein
MTSRSPRLLREGSVGLLILLGAGIFGGGLLWLRGINLLGERSYRVIVEFFSVSGLQVGAPVRFRGITVGRVSNIHPSPTGAEVELTITPASVVIPKAVQIEANQGGLISETTIDFTPLKSAPAPSPASNPIAGNCNRALIICNGDRLKGEVGISFDELIRLSLNLAELYSDPVFLKSLNQAIKSTSTAATEITTLSRDVAGLTRSLRSELPALTQGVRGEITTLSRDLRKQIPTLASSANAISLTANKLGLSATQVNELISDNEAQLVSTLDNLSQASADLKIAVQALPPLVDEIEQRRILENLAVFSANAAKASVNLERLTSTVATPATMRTLDQLLKSANATLQNTQKLTSDLDDVTGDPEVRRNLRNIINRLGKLLSSSRNFEQQLATARTLATRSLEPQPPASTFFNETITANSDISNTTLSNTILTFQERLKFLPTEALPTLTLPESPVGKNPH